MQHNMKILSLIFLLLGLASSAEPETCPNENAIDPCICEEDDDTGGLLAECGDEELTLDKLKQSLNGFAGKKDIDLVISDITLGTVPSNFFDGLGIKILDISHCPLDSLTEDGGKALLGLEDSLEELSILTSFTEDNVPTKLRLGHLRNLKDLDLSFNAITEMGDDWFDDGPSSLEYLSISNNGIEKIGDRAFSRLINLKKLSYDGNRAGPFKRSMLPSPAQRLETLELDNNAFTSIPEDLFSNMPALTGVTLRMNGILRLDERTWSPVWQQLHYIAIQGNPIECDSHLNWISNIKRTPSIYGKCNAPNEVSYEDIEDFIEKIRRRN